MDAKEMTIKIDPAVLDVYEAMNSNLYTDETKNTFAFKLMKFEFEKKIVDAVMRAYKAQKQ